MLNFAQFQGDVLFAFHRGSSAITATSADLAHHGGSIEIDISAGSQLSPTFPAPSFARRVYFSRINPALCALFSSFSTISNDNLVDNNAVIPRLRDQALSERETRDTRVRVLFPASFISSSRFLLQD